MEIQQARNKLEQKKGRKSQLEKNLQQAEKNITHYKKQVKSHGEAREVLNQLSMYIQERLQYNISNLTTLAIEAVLDDPYKLVVEFVRRRNKTECDIYFDYHGNRVEVKYGGGGAMDIAALALRIASWSMQRPRSRNTLILDEPFKHVKGAQANKNTLKMIKQISSQPEIGAQIIMVADERVSREQIIEVADRLFEFSLEDGVTQVKQLK